MTHFHIKSSTPGLGFEVRVFESRKCPIVGKKSYKKNNIPLCVTETNF